MIRGLALLLILLLIAAAIFVGISSLRSQGQSTANPPPSFGFKPSGCTGTLVVRLHSNHILRSVGYSLFIGNASYAHAYLNGTLGARQTLVLSSAEPCGLYSVYVSWRGGLWNGESAVVAQGRTTTVQFSNG